MSEQFLTYQQIVKKIKRKKVRIELKYCPFCGGTSRLVTGVGNYCPRLRTRAGIRIQCEQCKISTAVKQGMEAQLNLVKFWNTRAIE